MKKNILGLFLLNITLVLATTNLKFEILEKNNTEIKIMIKSDSKYEKSMSTKPISNIYIVKAGDTLTKIANKFNVSIGSLRKVNNIQNINMILINQKLIIK